MSILIRDMEMPKSCLECRLYNDPWCMAKNRNQWRTAYNRPPKVERQNDCPLIEVPPHGKLIDADALKNSLAFAENTAKWAVPALRAVLMVIDEMPTIIPPESEGE